MKINFEKIMAMLCAMAAMVLFSIIRMENVVYAADGDFEIRDGVLVRYDGSDENVVVPNGVTRIGTESFKGCTWIKSIELPNSVTSCGWYAFQGCSSLTSIVIPSSLDSITYDLFSGCSSLTSITIPSSVTSIESNAFKDCSSLTSIIIPDSVTRIGASAFNGCSSLTSVSIPDSITSMGYSVFNGCSSLTSICFPSSLTSIRWGTFYDCSSLTSISIPSSVTSIETRAFFNCDKSKLTIYGKKGSYAEEYAKSEGVRFVVELPFEDLQIGTWQYNTAKFVYDRKIITGTTATTFSPNSNMTRAQFMVILWRMAGSPKVAYANPYTDVPENHFAATAICWAKSKGLASGYNDGSFKPNSAMTRAQFCAFMQRYAKYLGKDVSTNGTTYTECKDADQVSKTFAAPIEWAYERGFIAADGKIAPNNNITRIQAAAILQRFMNFYKLS